MVNYCLICKDMVDASTFYEMVKHDEKGYIIARFGICPYCMENIRFELKKLKKHALRQYEYSTIFQK